MVPTTSVQLLGLKTSLKPPVDALSNIAMQPRLLLPHCKAQFHFGSECEPVQFCWAEFRANRAFRSTALRRAEEPGHPQQQVRASRTPLGAALAARHSSSFKR